MVLDPAFYKELKSAFPSLIEIWIDIAASQDKRLIYCTESEALTKKC